MQEQKWVASIASTQMIETQLEVFAENSSKLEEDISELNEKIVSVLRYFKNLYSVFWKGGEDSWKIYTSVNSVKMLQNQKRKVY